MTTNPQHKQEEGFFSFNFFTNCCANDRGADEFSDVDSSSRFNDASGVGTGREDEVGIVSGDNINYDRQSEYGSGNPDWTDVEDYQYQSDPNVSLPGTYVTYNHSQQHDVDYAPQQEPLDLDYIRKKSNDSDEEKAGSEISSNSKKISKPNKRKRKGSKGSNESKEGKGRNKRRPWQPHEDAKVLELVAKYGQSWALLASMITGRTGKQIRDRFLNKLKPNIKKGDWTQAEDALLVQLYYQIGHKWSKIATYLPGRTEGQVKNRFYSHVKKKILKDIPEGSASPSVDNGSTSPMTKAEQSPSHSNKAIRLEPVQQQNQQVFYQQQQHVQQNIPMTQNNFGNQRNVQFNADPTDVISYENPNFNHQNSNMNPPIANDQHGTSDSFVSYNAPTIQLEKEIDSVLNKYASFFDAPSTQNSHNLNVNFSPESGDTFEKLDRIEQLKQRKKNLEYLLTKTMQEITSGGGPQMNGFH